MSLKRKKIKSPHKKETLDISFYLVLRCLLMKKHFTHPTLLPLPHPNPHPPPLPSFPARVILFRKKKALKKNFKFLQKKIALPLLPMVKANGYGHEARWVAQTLLKEKNLVGFGVATFEEALSLRKALPSKTPILVFSDTSVWHLELFHLCKERHLTPVFFRIEDFKSFLKHLQQHPRPSRTQRYHLKINTGMNRLGIRWEEKENLFSILKKLPSSWLPQGICTHLAQAQSPRAPISRLQKKRCKHLSMYLRTHFPQILFHFGNSASILQNQFWHLDKLSHFARPGIALYGIPPWNTRRFRTSLHEVASLYARVLQTHQLQPKESVGYEASFQNQTKHVIPIATLGVGYGDGFFRYLGSKGVVFLSSKKCPILGLVSMDLLTVRCLEKTRVGQWGELFGSHLSIWDLAQKAHTIPYEILTSVHGRVQYVEKRPNLSTTSHSH